MPDACATLDSAYTKFLQYQLFFSTALAKIDMQMRDSDAAVRLRFH